MGVGPGLSIGGNAQRPAMSGLQARRVRRADQRIGSRKKEGISTGSVSTFGRMGAGQRGKSGSTAIGSGRGELQDAVQIMSASGISLLVGVMGQSPVAGIHAGAFGLPVGLRLGLDGLESGGVALVQRLLRSERPARIVEPGSLELQREA